MTAIEARRRTGLSAISRGSTSVVAAGKSNDRVATGARDLPRTRRHASRNGDQSSPSRSKLPIVAATCSSASRMRPRFKSASSISSCADWSNGESCSQG